VLTQATERHVIIWETRGSWKRTFDRSWSGGRHIDALSVHV